MSDYPDDGLCYDLNCRKPEHNHPDISEMFEDESMRTWEENQGMHDDE
jgi:hypothetical protein